RRWTSLWALFGTVRTTPQACAHLRHRKPTNDQGMNHPVPDRDAGVITQPRGAGPARLRGARVTHPTHRPVRTPLTMDCDLTGLLDVSQRPPAAAGGVSVRGPHPCGVECAAREDTAAADRRRGGAAARAG